MNEEILRLIREKGLLLEKDIFDIVNELKNVDLARIFLDELEKFSREKLITRSILNKNFEFIKMDFNSLAGDDKNYFENLFVRLGLNIEIRKEPVKIKNNECPAISYKIFSPETKNSKKLEVSDFVGNFRARYQQLQRILMGRPELQYNLMSINKISGNRQNLSIIGIVTEKRVTKNKNIIIKFEDLTGEIGAVVRADREELFKKAEELMLDDVVGVKASGNKDMLFAHDIFYPEAFVHEKVKFGGDTSIAFISDLHCGSKLHFKEDVERFLNWLNSGDEDAKKIKYLFFVGDNVDGVGIFPGQEAMLELKSMKEQYATLANYLKRIPKHITIFMCPGQHDAARVAEPQPIIDKRYAAPLYEIDNLVLVSNPSMVKLSEGNKELKVLMYHGASIHGFIDEIRGLREIRAHLTPAKAVKHMLMRRHLAPTHSSVTYIPNANQDPLVITETPDIVCTGEVHRLDIENHNGILIVTGSCWQGQTPYEEKVGNIPDPSRVPVLNLKTRELKIFYFGDEKKEGGDEHRTVF